MADPRFFDPITILADIGGISIDITRKVSENYEKIITENPIEDGSPTTDHITALPPKISIVGGFSDLRMTNLVGPALNLLNARKGLAKEQFDALLSLSASGETFNVMDGFHLIKDMQFKRLQLIKDKEGFSISFQADLWSIRKVGKRVGMIASQDLIDDANRFKTAPQLLLSVGSISVDDSLQSIGVLA